MEVRLYDRLFLDEAPGSHKDKDFLEFLNPDSLETINAKAEASLESAELHEHFQFMRLGYFCPDIDSGKNKIIFNKTVGLKDTWKKIQDKK